MFGIALGLLVFFCMNSLTFIVGQFGGPFAETAYSRLVDFAAFVPGPWPFGAVVILVPKSIWPTNDYIMREHM